MALTAQYHTAHITQENHLSNAFRCAFLGVLSTFCYADYHQTVLAPDQKGIYELISKDNSWITKDSHSLA